MSPSVIVSSFTYAPKQVLALWGCPCTCPTPLVWCYVWAWIMFLVLMILWAVSSPQYWLMKSPGFDRMWLLCWVLLGVSPMPHCEGFAPVFLSRPTSELGVWLSHLFLPWHLPVISEVKVTNPVLFFVTYSFASPDDRYTNTHTCDVQLSYRDFELTFINFSIISMA